ncbi:MAG: rhodanese-like domain-containing protein [Lachnospiraceae bacterium]|jgi:phage shock protein E|nr:rhodanese-like domain-containing protein [Lachnospiraceae bacterium]
MGKTYRVLAAVILGLSLLLSGCAGSGDTTAAAAASTGISGYASAQGAGSAEAAKNADGYTKIDAAAAKKMIDAGGVVIVDVRTAAEYDAEHIPDAINIPVESIGAEQPADLPDKDAVILIYCRTGIRAGNASKKLAAMGYTNIYDIGGIVDWPYDTVKK